MILGLDTECTGTDFWHGCHPFFVGAYTSGGQEPGPWHWHVDPHTRTPFVPEKDIKAIKEHVHQADSVVFHNAKFDIRALSTVGIPPDFFWNKEIHDTMLASHVLWSGESHALKDLCVLHLEFPDTDETELQKASMKARDIAKQLDWDVAVHGHPHFPGLPKNTKWHCMDYWIPGQMAKVKGYPADHHWHSVLPVYGINDPMRTVLLWDYLHKLLLKYELYDIYLKRRDLIRVVYEMEEAGLHLLPDQYEEEHSRYTALRSTSQQQCRKLAGNPDLNLNSHKQVSKFLFVERGLESIKQTKTGESVDGNVVDALLKDVRPRSIEYKFLANLQRYRKVDKCLDFLDSYLAYSMDHIVHPSINISGTGTTRSASHNPNGQNVSRQEKYNLRRVFGPPPGRAWLSVDYANIELRMLAYASGETELIKAFERGESVHMNFAWIICPWAMIMAGRKLDYFRKYSSIELWSEDQCRNLRDKLPYDVRKACEKLFKETDQYHWVKNGDFALTYGATEETADDTYHIPGAYAKIRSYFTHLDAFMSERVREAYRTHEVYTLGGYRLQIPYGREYTTAVDYYCQGSAGWVLCLGMLNCYQMFQTVNARYPGYNGRMLLQIHDELLFELPAKHRSNNKVISMIRKCMELPGTELGVPTPTEAKLITDTWADGVVVEDTITGIL